MDAIVHSPQLPQPQAAAPSPGSELVHAVRSQLSKLSGGLASDDYLRAWWDWTLNLAMRPDQQLALAASAMSKAAESWQFVQQQLSGQPHTPAQPDKNFAGAAWQQWPFNLYAHTYGQIADWSLEALQRATGTAPENQQRLQFLLRQALAAANPAHYLLTNPELLELTRAEAGANLVRGAQYWAEDTLRLLQGAGPEPNERFRVGENIAATPGTVVFQNELMELIQYSAQTDSVYAEPILITPAWIMKYYILDLSPANSLVRYLVEQGYTVFMISWKNPTGEDRELSMDDYVEWGLIAALDAVSAIIPNRPVHAVGYCIGGTLLSIGAAALARQGDHRIGTITLFAAQTDFSEPGELSVFISPSQLALLDSIMHQRGVLESERMGGAFALLRSSDLIWAPAIDNYLRGQRAVPNDLMAWNADGTRMPCRMHSEYLDRLYLHNELAKGSFSVAGETLSLSDLTVPMFIVGTETDHVAPWKSVYKVRALTRSSDYTFVLTSGGHNAGIISGPAHPRRHHRTLHLADAFSQVSAEQFVESAERQAGSWWPAWAQWLGTHSQPERYTLPRIGNAEAGYAPVRAAPGEYVRG
jgi:polyhydroxyalkanoate synthase subunit PhaC